jgi:hypothetical protein
MKVKALQYLKLYDSGDSAKQGCVEMKDDWAKRSCEEVASLSSSDESRSDVDGLAVEAVAWNEAFAGFIDRKRPWKFCCIWSGGDHGRKSLLVGLREAREQEVESGRTKKETSSRTLD